MLRSDETNSTAAVYVRCGTEPNMVACVVRGGISPDCGHWGGQALLNAQPRVRPCWQAPIVTKPSRAEITRHFYSLGAKNPLHDPPQSLCAPFDVSGFCWFEQRLV
jgi:hypothetical protein